MRAANKMRLKYATIFLAVVLLLGLAVVLAYRQPGAGTTNSAAQLTQTGDWPMLGHDAQRTNFNPHERTLSAANIDELAPVWRALINPDGTPAGSAPSVANGHLYIGGSAPTGPNFFAFDATSGAPLWQASLGYIPSPDVECIAVGIGSTAAISGSVLVVGGGDATYYGLNADTGATIWRDPVGAGHGSFAWTSPLPIDNRVYYGVASYCDKPSVRGEVRSVDLGSGRHLANRYIVPEGKAGGGVWHAPSLTPDGKTLLVATGEDYEGYDGPLNRALVSLDALSLDVLQSDQQGELNKDQDWGSTPVIMSNSQGRMLAGASHKDGTFRVYEIDSIAGGPLWGREVRSAVAMSPAYDPTFGPGGTLFFVGHKDNGIQLYAVDPATGDDRWTPITLPDYTFGNMAVANGLIYLNITGVLHIYDEHTGTLLRSVKPEDAGRSWTGPAVSHGFVYWTSGAYLNAWSLPGAEISTPGP